MGPEKYRRRADEIVHEADAVLRNAERVRKRHSGAPSTDAVNATMRGSLRLLADQREAVVREAALMPADGWARRRHLRVLRRMVVSMHRTLSMYATLGRLR